MSRIYTSSIHCTEVDYSWIKKNNDRITSHPAWVGEVSEEEANQLLKGKSALTYILRSAEKEYAYFISFVQQDQSIKHQYFTLELDRKGWYYKNGIVYKNGIATGIPTEIISENIDDLIPQMMHCHPTECKIFNCSHA